MPATQIITASLFAAVTLASTMPALAQNDAARGTPARQSMEQCVQTVLTRLGRANAPEAEVGQAVVQTCDSQLRATLAAAIQAGQAGGCTVETCMDIARSTAAQDAITLYRSRQAR
ncbi:MAG TPA: hypothetical protein VGU24_21840 [Microvirga sp.]|jgi:hypothetical protein|nr:hypothetical protein [Microvirga sp.]